MMFRLDHAIPILCLALVGCANDDRAARRAAAGPDPDLPALMRVADVGAGRRSAGQCLACHTVAKGGGNLAGPNLYAVIGRPIGDGNPRYGYTDALTRVGGRWDAAVMDRWLANPTRFAPGTTMRFPGITDPLERADVIAYLLTQSD